MLSLSDLDLSNKRVLIRSDLNAPTQDLRITSSFRLQAALPSIHTALDQNAKVIIVSHFGRPPAGANAGSHPEYSLAPAADWLSGAMERQVTLVNNLEELEQQSGVDLIMLENIRFFAGETENDSMFSKRLAAHCDVFVMDAFATAHRRHSSTYGVIAKAPVACAGHLLESEIQALTKVRDQAEQPLCMVVGGAKVSEKLTIIRNLCNKVDTFLVGGGIANTMLAAKGLLVGNSLYEPDLLDETRELMEAGNFILPEDVMVTQDEHPYGSARTVRADKIKLEDKVLDIGPKTCEKFAEHITRAASVIWNGPMGLFEESLFGGGTRTLGLAISNADCFSVTGGGDTLAAVEAFGILERFSLISTGGGAFLRFMEDKPLPAIEALSEAAKTN